MSTKSASASKPRANRATPVAPVVHPTIAPPAAAPIVETVVQLVPFAMLGRAPENVRTTRVAEDAAELADDIAAHGLLQSLIGYQDPAPVIFPAGYTWIVGGGRRLAALGILHERGLIDDAYRVPVLVRDVADAVELSLSENLARRDMSPVDEFFAFEQLLRPGTIDAAGLARRFGFTERYVKQRLRLAQLAPEILDGLRDRKLTIDAAMAYATTQDHDLQRRVFAVQSRVGTWKPHSPDDIRRDLAVKVMTADSPIATYVGAAAYEAAGGRYDDDLFANPLAAETRKLADSALARRLAHDKIRDGLVETVTRLNAGGAGLTAGALVAPDLEVGYWQWTKPKPPAGFVAIECTYDREKRWNAARNSGAQIKGVIGLDINGALVLVDTIFFVDKEKAREVRPPEPKRTAYVAPTEEERAHEQREHDIRLWSRRLALGGFADTKFDGVAFWPESYRHTTVEDMQHPTLGAGHAVFVRLFVPADAALAHVPAAIAKLDVEAREHAATVAAAAAAVARAGDAPPSVDADPDDRARLATDIAAMSPEPAAILADGKVWFRWADGIYADVPETTDADIYGQDYDDLTELLAGVGTLTAAFATIADLDAERGEPVPPTVEVDA